MQHARLTRCGPAELFELLQVCRPSEDQPRLGFANAIKDKSWLGRRGVCGGP